MADHSLNALRAAAKAMEEVVLQAIDPSHPLAREQATLVAKYLRFFEQRLDYAQQRNRFELAHYLALGKDSMDDARAVSPAVAQALGDAVRQAQALVDDAGARPSGLQAAAQELGGVLTALLRTAAAVDAQACGRIESRVLGASRRLLDMQRAWFLPQGWEPDPAAVPPIDKAIAAS